MPLQLQAATSGSTTLVPTDAVTATLTLPSSTGTLLSTANPQSGGVIQVVSALLNTTFSTTSTSLVDTGLTVSITPKFSTSKILVIVDIMPGESNSTVAVWQLVRNSTSIAVGTGGTFNSTGAFVPDSGGNAQGSLSSNGINYLDSPATTSATTYKIQMLSNNGSAVYLNRRGADNYANGTSGITVMEVAA